ncbi:hypothetical protein PP178_02785 [Zeaxanthinibacter sp. PT1]|uniref:hypothetical protein n=1 Tax=Zeaxanthinibacter TaxID=561554 RepID=UPI00234B51E5|nr:hypothetical protein [Zeaxanthinibacter sp. PT1]MDC6350462.1 hypothetical protein [Zeaxanthinibacter sp. PT1]
MGEGKIHIPLIYSINYSKKEWNISELNYLLQQEEEKLIEILERIEYYSRRFLIKILNTVKLNILEKETRDLGRRLIELKDDIHVSTKNVKYFENLKPSPKCLECGNEKLQDKPIHKCGGEIQVVTDQTLRIVPSEIIDFIYEYDNYGNVIKVEAGGGLNNPIFIA